MIHIKWRLNFLITNYTKIVTIFSFSFGSTFQRRCLLLMCQRTFPHTSQTDKCSESAAGLLSQSSNWARSWSWRTTDTECSLQLISGGWRPAAYPFWRPAPWASVRSPLGLSRSSPASASCWRRRPWRRCTRSGYRTHWPPTQPEILWKEADSCCLEWRRTLEWNQSAADK